MILLLSIVGALAVAAFLGFLALALLKGWQDPPARVLLRIAGGLGIVCAVLGVLLPLVGG